MSALSKGGTRTISPPNLSNLPGALGSWLIRNKVYFLAFAVPVVVMYIAYAIFEFVPFGDNSVLVLDLNGQYVYYFESIRNAFWGDESIFYNWSRNLSGGYAGVIGYYLASPLTLIPVLLPRTMLLGSLEIMILTKLGLASVAMSYYLRKSKNVSALASVVFGSLYAMCAYGVIQAMDPMWLDGVYLLPFVILGVEHAVDDGRKLNLIIPLAMIFVFNFYIGYIVGIFTVLYFIFYLATGGSEKKRKRSIEDILKPLASFAVAGITALMLSAFMILMVYKALQLGKFDFTEPDFSFATQFNPLDFFPQLLPAQFDSVNVDGLPEIYCGVLTVVMLPLFYLNGKISIRKKIGYTAILLVLFICMYIRPLDMVWHGFQMPNWLPFRYSFTFSFLLVSMGAVSFANLEGMKASAICGSAFCIAAFLAVAVSRNKDYLTGTEILIAAAFAAVYCALILIFRNNPKALKVSVPIMLMAVCSGEQIYNNVTVFKDEDKSLVYSKSSPWYNFIDNNLEVVKQLDNYNKEHGNENDGFFRADKTYHRTVNDASALGLRAISHSSSVMNARILKFLEAMGFSTSTYYSRFDGNTPITDALLGVKYSLDRTIEGDTNARRMSEPSFEPIFAYNYKDENDKDVRIDAFKNPDALSLGYMADQNIRYVAAFGNDNTFNSQNLLLSTIAGHTDINLQQGTFDSFQQYFVPLDVNKDSFILNNVTTSPYGKQTMYTAAAEGDPTVNMHIVPEKDGPVYIYFQTENQKSVNLWLSTQKGADGNYTDHKFVGSYFENHDYHALDLGDFKAGEEFELRMTGANEYTILNNFYFYQFDHDTFKADIDMLKQNQWNITEFGGDYIKGDINAPEGKIMLTSIPYEEGWTVKVDGETVDFVNKDQKDESGGYVFDKTDKCWSMYFEALIGIKLPAGQHTIEMSYTPPGLIPGILLFFAGVICTVLIYRYDRKHNEVLIAAYKLKVQSSDGKLDKQPEKGSLEKKPEENGAKPSEEGSEEEDTKPEQNGVQSSSVKSSNKKAAQRKSKGKKKK